MDEHGTRRHFDSNSGDAAGIGEILSTGARAFRLGLGGLLCITGFFLGLQLFFTAFGYVTEPETLHAVLDDWDRPEPEANPAPEAPQPAPAAPALPSATEPAVEPDRIPLVDSPQDDAQWFIDFLNGIVAAVSKGDLARPMGGFVLFLLMTILARIALGLITAGAMMLDVGRKSGTQP